MLMYERQDALNLKLVDKSSNTSPDLEDLDTADVKIYKEDGITNICVNGRNIADPEVPTVLNFRGVSTTDPIAEGPTVEGVDTFNPGDVIIYKDEEYLYDGEKWHEFGNETGYVLNTQKINGQEFKGDIDTYMRVEFTIDPDSIDPETGFPTEFIANYTVSEIREAVKQGKYVYGIVDESNIYIAQYDENTVAFAVRINTDGPDWTTGILQSDSSNNVWYLYNLYKGIVPPTPADTDKQKYLKVNDSGKLEYSYLPIASSTTLGGVKPEAKTDAMTSPVGIDSNGKLWHHDNVKYVDLIPVDDSGTNFKVISGGSYAELQMMAASGQYFVARIHSGDTIDSSVVMQAPSFWDAYAQMLFFGGLMGNLSAILYYTGDKWQLVASKVLTTYAGDDENYTAHSKRIEHLNTPTEDTDAANKQYVDSTVTIAINAAQKQVDKLPIPLVGNLNYSDGVYSCSLTTSQIYTAVAEKRPVILLGLVGGMGGLFYLQALDEVHTPTQTTEIVSDAAVFVCSEKNTHYTIYVAHNAETTAEEVWREDASFATQDDVAQLTNKVNALKTLPDVTAADNDKVLSVKNGAWAATESPDQIFIISLTEKANAAGEYTADKTYAQIKAAFDQNRPLEVEIDSARLPFMNVQFAANGDAGFTFGYTQVTTDGQLVSTRAVNYYHATDGNGDSWADADQVGEYLKVGGGAMSGDLSMGGANITNVQEVQVIAQNPLYLGNVIHSAGTTGVRITSTTSNEAAVVAPDSQSTYRPINVGEPTADTHAVTLGYLTQGLKDDTATKNSINLAQQSGQTISLQNGVYLLTACDTIHRGLTVAYVCGSTTTIADIAPTAGWSVEKGAADNSLMVNNTGDVSMDVYIIAIGAASVK